MTGHALPRDDGTAPFEGLIAIVDDDLSVRQALERLLGSVGIRTVGHGSGLDFLESPALHDADCLLLDLHLPGMSGSEVLGEVQVTSSKLPVVLMTGRYDRDFAQKALAAGASGFLSKPFSGESLFEALSTATGKKVGR